MTVQAKFWMSDIHHQSPARHTKESVATVTMQPIYADGGENDSWSKYTPSGKIEMCITNPDAVDRFELGQEYLITFERADQK